MVKVNLMELTPEGFYSLQDEPISDEFPIYELTEEQWQEIIEGKKVLSSDLTLIDAPLTKEERIINLKEQLQKYKEDIEQVELFGMERADYEEKKSMCKNIVLELRELERN